jgi:hypothetical protein
MIAIINNFQVDLSNPLIFQFLLSQMQIQSAWYVEKPEIEPVRFGEWVGKVSSGMSSTNFNNILLIPMDTGHGMSGSYHK